MGYVLPLSRFHDRSRTFNGKIKLLSKVVVSPLDAKDVSAIVRFCAKHQLSPSVRAGGYGIAGWAVAGDVIIDMGMIKDVDIEAPIHTDDGVTWTKLQDMPEPGSKGKGRAVLPTTHQLSSASASASQSSLQDASRTNTKRPREEDAAEQIPRPIGPVRGFGYNPWTAFDAASEVTGGFLRGPAFAREEGETPREPPMNRPRLHSPEPDQSNLQAPPLDQRQSSSGSELSSGGSALDSRISFSLSNSTAETTPPPSADKEEQVPATYPPPSVVGAADPFGYISGVAPSRLPMYGGVDPPMPTFAPPSAPGPSWSSSGVSSSPFGSLGSATLGRPMAPLIPPNLFGAAAPGGLNSTAPAPAQPVHSHAYVTFGAGMKQKEVDIYTAEHPLEGTSSVTGMREEGLVPYHIPS